MICGCLVLCYGDDSGQLKAGGGHFVEVAGVVASDIEVDRRGLREMLYTFKVDRRWSCCRSSVKLSRSAKGPNSILLRDFNPQVDTIFTRRTVCERTRAEMKQSQ